jgi:hypothetical protein
MRAPSGVRRPGRALLRNVIDRNDPRECATACSLTGLFYNNNPEGG